MLTCNSFFDTGNFPHQDLFQGGNEYVWEPLNRLHEYLQGYPFPAFISDIIADNKPLKSTLILHNDTILKSNECRIVFGDTCRGKLQVFHRGDELEGASVIMAGAFLSGDQIEIGKGVLIESGAMIKSPTVIGDCTEVRQGAYLRGNIVCGRRCVLGHTTEIKHAIFLDDAKAGHFNYIGDSILGNDTNLGAGTKLANLRFFDGNIYFSDGETNIDSGRKKFGAILGDRCQTGCNSVTNPGTLLGKDSFIMPNTAVPAGYHRAHSIIR